MPVWTRMPSRFPAVHISIVKPQIISRSQSVCYSLFTFSRKSRRKDEIKKLHQQIKRASHDSCESETPGQPSPRTAHEQRYLGETKLRMARTCQSLPQADVRTRRAVSGEHASTATLP